MSLSRSPLSRSEQESRQLLRIYVNDHRAGAVAGTALARRMLESNQGTALGETMRDLVPKIESDAELLENLAHRFGLRVNPLKKAMAAVAERAGRLKFNGRLRSYSPLSQLVEIEVMLAGISTKRLLWSSLSTVETLRDVDGIDLSELAESASQQWRALVAHHRIAAQRAVATA
jgi:hypothetical protein